MAKIEIQGVDGVTEVEAPAGARLVNVLAEAGVDLGHRCGGWAKCTTCRVEIPAGEPEKMTEAEAEKLRGSDLLGKVRLACQIEVEGDMTVHPLMLASSPDTAWDDPGTKPEERITPEPVWINKLDAERR